MKREEVSMGKSCGIRYTRWSKREKGVGVMREEHRKEGDERAYDMNADPRWSANPRGLPSCDTLV